MAANARFFDASPALRARLAFALAWATAAAYYLLLRHSGPFGDEGSYCTIAQGIVDGALPYRDYFNEKPPVQYFWTALVFSLFGSGIDSSRIAASAMLGIALSITLLPLSRRPHALLQLLFWTAALASLGLLMRAYNNLAESTLAVLFVASLALMLRPGANTSGHTAFAVGLLQGLACGVRQSAWISALLLGFTPWTAASRPSYLAGLLCGLAAWIAPLAILGILGETFSATLLFHADNSNFATYFSHHGENKTVALLIWLAIVASVYSHAKKNGHLWMVLWLIIAALPFFGRLDAFRLWPSILMGLAYLIGSRSLAPNPRLLLAGTLILPAIAIGLYKPGDFNNALAISREAARQTAPDDRIWAGPFAPNLYCLSQRRPASRYYFSLPWTMKPDAQAALLHDLQASPPKLIIDTSSGDLQLTSLVPGMGELLARHYQLVNETKTARFYLRKPTPASASFTAPPRSS